ncbi:uncharacterized protein LOC143196706 [Rhynchophorus ferrugineus]|uniref:Uncharacterized protein n=1 Tax=Rhynchophorus ferrugineus TaxID=354439 RepID=A0A834IN29_RHYFE|nr:hypothetical protein GWI33_004499 [Rhynchophorus ferrugineus]
MSTNGNLGETVLNAVKSEAEAALKKAQSDMEEMVNSFTKEAKDKIDLLIQEADCKCQEIRKSTDDQVKSEINKAIKEYSNILNNIGKEMAKTINDSWAGIKIKIESALEVVRGTLGKQTKEIEVQVKQMFKYADKVIADCIKTIQNMIKSGQSQLKNIGQKYIKNTYLTQV